MFYADDRSSIFNYRNKYGLYKHIFQVIWNSSTLLGVGRANIKQNGMSCSYFVARYKPAGNYEGNYKSNVFKGRFTKAICSGLDDGRFKKEDIKDSPVIRFDENGLQAHNKFRAIHGATDMKIDPTLSKDAELYAKELTKLDSFQHLLKRNKAGESLTYACTPEKNYQLSAREATKRW